MKASDENKRQKQEMKADTKDSKNGKVALANTDFKGTCHKCGKTGHKKADCKEEAKKTKLKGTCNHCNKKGHKEKDCFEKEENESKRPKNWKSKMNKEETKQEVSGSNMEILLTNIEMNEGQDFWQGRQSRSALCLPRNLTLQTKAQNQKQH